MLSWEEEFWAEMLKMNWIPGKTVVVYRVFADWKVERLGELAQRLAQKRVDVILCNGDDDAAVAAARVTRTIPIVFADAFAPIEQGLIDSFARLGHNLTGLSMYAGADFATKRLEFLRAMAPSATRLSWQLHQPCAALILAGHLADVPVVLGQSLVEAVHFT